MNVNICPNCKKEVYGNSSNCYHCGFKLKKKRNPIVFVATAVGIALFIAFVYFIGSAESDNSVKTPALNETHISNDPLKIGIENVKALEGKKVPYSKWKYGVILKPLRELITSIG